MKHCTNKECTQQNPQPLSAFSKRKNGHQPRCRECLSIYHKQRRKAKNSYVTSLQRENRAILKSKIEEFIASYLSNHSCVHCGETNILTLEFDHCRGKKSFAICDAIGGVFSLERIKKELEKCQVLCSNCHSIKTATNNGSWKLKYIPRLLRMNGEKLE